LAKKRTPRGKPQARKTKRVKVSKSQQPQKRSKLTGRFATERQRARDSIRQLQRQAAAERAEQKRLKPPSPKFISGKTGRYIKAPTGHQSPADKALGKLTKREVTRRTEERLGLLDNGQLPPYDAKKIVTGIDRVSRTYLYYWRYEGLLGEDMARGTLRALIRYSEHDSELVARVVIRTGYGKHEKAVNSHNGYPQQVLTWLDDLLARESVDEILGISEGNELRFEVIAITRIEMERNGGLGTAKERVSKAKKTGKQAKRGNQGSRGKRVISKENRNKPMARKGGRRTKASKRSGKTPRRNPKGTR